MVTHLRPNYCGSAPLEALLDQIRAASDIMKDGTQDPNMPCDGISIGVGFTAKRVQLGGEAPAPEPPADPCL